MNNQPLVSIIIPLYNHEKYIRDALFQKKITDSNFNRHILSNIINYKIFVMNY